jgi:CheY-like chemotaxis protein
MAGFATGEIMEQHRRKQSNFSPPEIGACRAARRGVNFSRQLFGESMKASANQAASKPTVFVVDDEPMLLELAALIIKPLGCEVRTFRDPETALKEFAAARPDLVLTDYAMGRMNGMDLVRECRRLHPAQKIILVSGTVDEHVFSNAPAKPDRFLSKPYQLQELSDCVRELIAA